MKIAILGGGLFGCTAAIYAGRAGHDVHLFEVKHDLMVSATACSFNRLHRGAHYPRDAATGRECRRAFASFRDEFGDAIIPGGDQFYVIPEVGSRVSRNEFRNFIDNEGLSFSEVKDGTFLVDEPRVCFSRLSQIVHQEISRAGIKVHLRHAAALNMRNRFDKIVVATYASLNEVLTEMGCPRQRYRFQVVERPLVLMPDAFAGQSIVVIDGPFGCIDPLDNTEMHIVGHVVHANHLTNVGYRALIPDYLAALINKGLIVNPEHTNFRRIIEDLSQYIPGIEAAKHVGSTYTVRAVLADQEQTDCRPTLVTQHDDQVFSIFSGKLGTACRAAADVVEMISDKEMVAA
jgi:hypothetical protein